MEKKIVRIKTVMPIKIRGMKRYQKGKWLAHDLSWKTTEEDGMVTETIKMVDELIQQLLAKESRQCGRNTNTNMTTVGCNTGKQ